MNKQRVAETTTTEVTLVWPRDPRRGSHAIQTVRVGERIRVHLRGRQSDTTNAWAGRVVDVDARAIRLDVTASRFGMWWSDHPAGQIVVPWARVDCITVRAAA